MKFFKLYTYNSESLQYETFSGFKAIILSILFMIFLSLSFYTLGEFNGVDNIIKAENSVILIKKSTDDFTEEKLRVMLEDLNVLHPEIIIAQSQIETGNYNSRIFKENNNLFGMKEAVVRAHTARGTQYGHAYYDTWRESVYDYALYQSRYLSKLKKKDEYFEYLSQNYAEDKNYVNKIKKIIKDGASS